MFTTLDQYQFNPFNPFNPNCTGSINNPGGSTIIKKSTYSDTPTIITSNSTSLDSIDEMNSSSYIDPFTNNNNNNSNNNNNNATVQQIKEIEDYYLKSLLNADENNNNNINNITHNVNNTNTSIFNNNHYTTGAGNNQAYTSNLNSQANSFKNGYQQFDYLNHNASNNNNVKRNTLEVDINNNFNNSLPLTTENLEKLSLSNNTQLHLTNYNNTTNIPHNNLYTPQLSVQYQQQLLQQQQQQQQQQLQQQHQQQQQQLLLQQQQFQNQTNVLASNENNPQQQEINKQLYKTELCESFTTKGFCKYNNKCQFAHGFNELKFKQRTNNFRTKPCINWEKLGYCPYGKRCLFKHGDNKDIQLYVKAGTLNENDPTVSSSTNEVNQSNSISPKPRRKNLHVNVKKLQKITW